MSLAIIGKIASQVKDPLLNSVICLGAITIGGAIGLYSCEEGGSPSSSTASSIYRLSKILCDKMLIHTQTPSFLRLNDTLDPDGKESQIMKSVNLSSGADGLKFGARLSVAAVGGYLYVLSHIIDKCDKKFSNMFSTNHLQSHQAAVRSQSDILQNMAQKEQELHEKIEILEEEQAQFVDKKEHVQEEVEHQSQLINKIEQSAFQAVDELTLEQAEKGLQQFVDSLGHLPSHDERVKYIAELMKEVQGIESLQDELQQELIKIARLYTEEVNLFEQTVIRAEQLVKERYDNPN